jgi:predicted RNA-binding Zn-ribbon protein involved in translation (DUF1610 family)
MSVIADHIESNDGFCTHCGEWTALGGVEPDAHEYECDECGNMTVYGAEECVMMGIVPEDDFGDFDDE